jgi:uncharacterized protein YjbJ (UPF0337 family)
LTNWKISPARREALGKLTDDDWNAITGKKEQLAARIEQRCGRRAEAESKSRTGVAHCGRPRVSR